jgi:hypothetical protein
MEGEMEIDQTNNNAGDVNNVGVPRMQGIVIDRLVELARLISQAVQGELPARMSVEVAINSGVESVRYTACCGEITGRGLAESKYAFGDNPETVAQRLIEEVADREIAIKLREEKLRTLAKALGFRIARKKAGESDAAA